MGCPDESDLLDFAMGRLRGDAQAAIERHIDGCSACFEVIASLVVQDEPVSPPGKAGRYELDGVLGSGAMGTVYAAHDPVLDRTVAVKVLRTDRAATEPRRLRLLREAQSLARIRHPNVVSVYGAGETGGRVYVAMELIAGRPLGEHLQRTRPGWREIIRLFLDAGRGLSAAHEVGIVHRDFKPANVLVDASARVVVTDFGLAAADTEVVGAAEREPPALLGHALSTTRARIGTPAYMAPEQFGGQRATVRSDQFAFCVAVVEALVGRRPFGTTAQSHASDERLARALAGLPGPAQLMQVLGRGLSVRPEDRFPTMPQLLDALGRCLSVRRRRVARIAFALVALVATGAAWARSQPPEACDDPMEGSWTPRRAARVAAAIDAPPGSRLVESARRGMARLDAHAGELHAAFASVCSAMPRRIEDASAPLRSQWSCVQTRRARFEAIVDQFDGGEPEALPTLLGTVARLAPLSSCLDPALSARAAPPPDDPRLDADVRDVRIALQRARVRQEAGRRDSLAELQALAARGDALEFDPLTAELHLHLGVGRMMNADFTGAERDLERAYAAGAHGGHEMVAAAAIRSLMQALQMQGRFEDARTWAKAAAPLHRTDWERVELSIGLGHIATSARELDVARDHFDDAFAHREACGSCRGAPVALDSMLASYFADYLAAAEDWPAAREHYARSLELDRDRLGPGHAVVADALVALADVDRELGDADLAETEVREAIAIADELGVGIPAGWATLGELQLSQGEHEHAIVSFDTALGGGAGALFDAVVGVRRAAALDRVGRHEDARRDCASAVGRLEQALGQRHPRTVEGMETCETLGGDDADQG